MTWKEEYLIHLQSGHTVLSPTDTIWGIMGNAMNQQVAFRIYTIKQRPLHKYFILLVSDEAMLSKYVCSIPNKLPEILSSQHRPTTVIYDNVKHLPSFLLSPDGSVAIRICKVDWLSEIIEKLGNPIISTSANISSEPSPKTFQDIPQQIKNSVDFVVDRPIVAQSASSKIIRILGDSIQVIRE